jgi:hypothetical protein
MRNENIGSLVPTGYLLVIIMIQDLDETGLDSGSRAQRLIVRSSESESSFFNWQWPSHFESAGSALSIPRGSKPGRHRQH